MSSLDYDLIQSVIEHMNDDHGAAVLVYVQAFAGQINAESAILEDLDTQGLRISYLEAGLKQEVRVPFECSPDNASDIRAELVRMAKEGRKRLAS